MMLVELGGGRLAYVHMEHICYRLSEVDLGVESLQHIP